MANATNDPKPATKGDKSAMIPGHLGRPLLSARAAIPAMGPQIAGNQMPLEIAPNTSNEMNPKPPFAQAASTKIVQATVSANEPSAIQSTALRRRLGVALAGDCGSDGVSIDRGLTTDQYAQTRDDRRRERRETFMHGLHFGPGSTDCQSQPGVEFGIKSRAGAFRVLL
jgi:hypothetical protein